MSLSTHPLFLLSMQIWEMLLSEEPTLTHTITQMDKPSCKAPFTSCCPKKDNIFRIHHTSDPPECKIDSSAGRPLNLMDEQLMAPLYIM